jgi:hypothetical protein
MAAIPVHVVTVAVQPISRVTGLRVDKTASTTTIKDTLQTENQHVIMPDQGVPNSIGYPTIKAYLEAEAADGYISYHIDQYMIVTYQI